MIIKYIIITLRYTIFFNISYIIRKITTKPNSINIKYSILNIKIDASNIKYVKIYKSNQE